ncbi:TylF/MycF family methyltransferase [Patescibacteria group bacterium]|nr:TylF/MycF family methyltransferase [Patescibacteria group bacterium]MBU0846458.1 TylF/MycF family methyltransferase [Patescibacteria group bacterium]
MSKSDKDQRQYDGRANYQADDEIEVLLDEHFKRYGITIRETCRNFQVYTRRVFLKRFLAHYEFFRMTINLPGDIVELGVYRGVSLMAWANFLEVRNMGDRAKQVIGFDNWAGFTSFDEKDGKEDTRVNKVIGGYNAATFKEILIDAITIFDKDRFIPHKPRILLVDGNIEDTIPRFVVENPGLRISLLHVDCDLYQPTKVALEVLWPRVVNGGVVIFDDYGIRPWEGESTAVDEYFADKDVVLRRLDWAMSPSAYIIKGQSGKRGNDT